MNQVVHNAGRFRRGLGACGLRPVGMGDDTATNSLMDSGSSYFDYYDSAAGVYYDEFGNPWDVPAGGPPVYTDSFGNSWFTDPTGQFTGSEYDYQGNYIGGLVDVSDPVTGDINLAKLGQTWEWTETNGGSPVQLPNVSLPYSYILQIPDSGIIPPGLSLPPVVNALPPSVLAKLKAALAKVAKNVSMSAGSGSGAAAGGRPLAVQPNAQGQCPTGYAKNAAGQCVLVSAKPASTGNLFSNPLYLFLAAIGLILLVKR